MFSTETRTLFWILGDRQWHDYRQVKERLASTVGPGKALRRYQERLDSRRERGGHQGMQTEPSEDDKIRWGQKLVADNVLQGLKRNWLDVENEGGGFGTRMIRLKPTATVPHERNQLPAESTAEPPGEPEKEETPEDPDEDSLPELDVPRSEMALFSEREVRALVAEEVGRQLDRFQQGLQQWLGTYFSDPDHRCVLSQLQMPPKSGVEQAISTYPFVQSRQS